MSKEPAMGKSSLSIDFSHIDYGEVSKYIEDRGFGFVKSYLRRLECLEDELFFHASKIKEVYTKAHVSVDRISSNDVFEGLIQGAFWYEYQYTPKGWAIKRIFTREDLIKYQNDIRKHIPIEKIINSYIKTIDHQLSTKNIELIGLVYDAYVVSQLEQIKAIYIQDKEAKRREKERQRLLEERERVASLIQENAEQIKWFLEDNDIYMISKENPEKLERINEKIEYIDNEYGGWEIKFKDQLDLTHFDYSEVRVVDKAETEFKALVEEMRPLGFVESAQVSNYIVQNRLHLKYKHLSGLLHMEKYGERYDFVGGIQKNYYARLCAELDLENRKSGAHVLGFTSFATVARRLKK